METMLSALKTKQMLNLRGCVVDLSTPKVMGILNITPDSFYDGDKYQSEELLLGQVEKMLLEGAAIIDLGAASSKPNAAEVSEAEEIKRLLPVLKSIIKKFPEVKISVDTFRSNVARLAVEEGAVMINDISGGELDAKMFETVAELKVAYVLMHMRGTSQTMQQMTSYDDMLKDIMDYFHAKVFQLKSLGVHDIIIDPGFGFAKNIKQNYQLLKNLPYFKMLNLPILAGLSRKSMIYKHLGINSEEALNGTTVLNTMALLNGSSILRVHDVKAAVETVELYKKTYLEN